MRRGKRPPRGPRARGSATHGYPAVPGLRCSHVAVVIVPKQYPSAPPPQSPPPFPGPSESDRRGRIARTRARTPRRACRGPRVLRDGQPPPPPPAQQLERILPPLVAHPAAAGGRLAGRAGHAPRLAAQHLTRDLPPQLLGEGGGRCLRRAASSPPPPRLPPRHSRPLPPPPLRLLLLAVPAAVRRARRWPVGRATWIT